MEGKASEMCLMMWAAPVIALGSDLYIFREVCSALLVDRVCPLYVIKGRDYASVRSRWAEDWRVAGGVRNVLGCCTVPGILLRRLKSQSCFDDARIWLIHFGERMTMFILSHTRASNQHLL